MRIHRALGVHRRHRVVVAAASTTAIIAALVAPTAAHAEVLTSVTYAGVGMSQDGSTVYLTAIVNLGQPVNMGLGVTPSGSVNFYDDAGDGLATVPIPTCLLSACTVSTTVPSSVFSDGVSEVIARYSGDTLVSPSQDRAPFAFTNCGDGGSCHAYTEAGNADLEVSSSSDQGYIEASLGGDGLPCGVNGGGPVGNVIGVDLNQNKEIYYMLTGDGAQAYADLQSQLNEANWPWFCYVSPDEFQAYSQGGGSVDFPANDSSFAFFGDAPQIGSGPYTDEYVGLLPMCSYYDGPINSDSAHPNTSYTSGPPCIEDFSLYQNGDHDNEWELSVYLLTPPGDPHMGGLQLPALPKS